MVIQIDIVNISKINDVSIKIGEKCFWRYQASDYIIFIWHVSLSFQHLPENVQL